MREGQFSDWVGTRETWKLGITIAQTLQRYAGWIQIETALLISCDLGQVTNLFMPQFL